MSELQQFPTLPNQPFRLDVPLHELLQQPSHDPSAHRPELRATETLPPAVFPQHPQLFHDLDEQDIAAHEAVVRTGKRHWPASKVMSTMRGWMLPYLKSRVLPGDFDAAKMAEVEQKMSALKRRLAQQKTPGNAKP